MIKIGDIVKTSYGTGPYRITSITHGCTCPSYLATINMLNPPSRPPHMHIVCVPQDVPVGEEKEKDRCWLNDYYETPDGKILSVDGDAPPGSCIEHDELFIIGHEKDVQLSIFDAIAEESQETMA